MEVSHENTSPVTTESALDKLRKFIEQRSMKITPSSDLESFERELHACMVAIERDIMAEEFARWDVNMPYITLGGRGIPAGRPL